MNRPRFMWLFLNAAFLYSGAGNVEIKYFSGGNHLRIWSSVYFYR